MQKIIYTVSLCLLTILFLSPIESQRTYAQTEIPAGDVSGTWTKANSPYNINGEITIPNDSTLTIEPGVEVIFTGHYKFNVQGRLLAIGTETDTIVFTINDTTGFHNLTIPDGGWGGIKLIDIDSSNDSTIIEYCSFQYGKSDYGGAIFSTTDKLRISHCLFRNNLCFSSEPNSGAGGAIYITGSNPVIEYCEFSWNQAGWGDALYIWVSDDAIIRNNHFHHNSGSATIVINSSYLNFKNNLIEQNHSSNYILFIGFLCQSNIDNNAEKINNSFVTEIKNNTIVNNTCTQSGAIQLNHGRALFINNIVYGNEPTQVYVENPSSVGFYNCLIEGGKEGFTGAAFTGAYENCLDVDPQFVSSNDYHLRDNSNCIGAAIDSVMIDGTWYHCPPIDFEGNPRPNPSGSMPDIGAYENPLAIPSPTEIPAGDVSGTWTKAYSPYHINGEITIPNDSTLTIEPGVEVVFTGHYKFNVKGRLLAIGTETDTILFTINDTTGFHHLTLPDGGWHGIKIYDVAVSNDSTIFEYCTFEYGKSNTGSGIVNRSGGAIYSTIDKLRISHCLFRYNKSYSTDTWEGTSGAILIVGNPIIEYSEFCWNESSWGSAMCVAGNTTGAIIRNNHYHHNTGHGTINICVDAYPTFINNLIEYNHSYGEPSTPHGHGILHFSNNNNAGYAKIINNTIVNNTNVGEGGGIFVRDGNPTFINNIVYGNEPSQVNFLWASSVGFYNNLIEGGREGFTGAAFTGAYENCIDADPLFVSSSDFHLQDNSPCIGAGYYEEGVIPTYDYEGNPRPNPLGSMPDIGAYENLLASPLPVELTSFAAAVNGNEVTLIWTTATELNNQGFEVQRKFGSNDFVTVGSVKGNGTTTSPNNYSFIDKLIDGGKYSYRLKQIDFDGTFEYSDVVEVDVRLLDKFNLEQNYPNPFNPTTKISYAIPLLGGARGLSASGGGGFVTLKVFDVLGKEIKTLVNEEKESGYHSVDFNASELPSGVYFYRLQTGSYVETKKMILLR